MPIKKELLHHYTSADYIEARKESRARSKGRCKLCGVKNGTVRKVTKIILCTRHVDGNPANNHPYNLIQLCQACHLEAARRFNRDRQMVLFSRKGD